MVGKPILKIIRREALRRAIELVGALAQLRHPVDVLRSQGFNLNDKVQRFQKLCHAGGLLAELFTFLVLPLELGALAVLGRDHEMVEGPAVLQERSDQ